MVAFDELIETASILEPMTYDGQLGFGHLCFQEYLVACELKENRGIEIAHQLYDGWWRGALTLFSQMTENIEFLISWLAQYGTVSDASETLESMLAVRPRSERKGIREILDGHMEVDILDEGLKMINEDGDMFSDGPWE